MARCAARGLRVLGLEQFSPAHDRGASHGLTRIIRQAYFEGAAYVPLLLRAYELWDDLERRTGATLRARTGGLFVGTPDRAVVAGTLLSAGAHSLEHDILDATALRRRYPQFRPRDDEIAVFESVAGALFPERCILAHLQTAMEDGAEARFGSHVDGWDTLSARVTVATPHGELEARRLVLCTGPWFDRLVAGFEDVLRIERNVQMWFLPAAPAEVASHCMPIFAIERAEWPFMLYGFPDFGDGVKCAFHHSGRYEEPERLDRNVAVDEVDAVRDALHAWLPAAAGPLRAAAACMYAMTPDEHFIVGTHPEAPQVVLAGGFSGHGFKFCPVIGEIVADLVTEAATEHDIGMFSPRRFTRSTVA